MFKSFRQLEISLAAKCQLLFGAAVVLIIAAALAVPLQRMEQLTTQLNERSARTLTDYAVAEHVAGVKRGVRPTTRNAVVVRPPTTNPLLQEEGFALPRLILANEGRDESALTMFEKRAVHRLRERDREWIASAYESGDGTKGYRFARMDASCNRCHGVAAEVAATTTSATQPTTLAVALTFSAVKRDGSDAGTRSRQSTCQGVAAYERSSSWARGSSAR